MNSQIAAILTIDGIASGAIYVLIAIGFVLIFAVTRIIFVPFGDVTAFTALTLASLEGKQLPGTIGMVAVLAALATLMEIFGLWRADELKRIPRALFFYLVLPLAPAAVIWLTSGTLLPAAARIVLTVAVILPIAPLLNRIVYRPIADSTVLVLLIVSVALHFALYGKALYATSINRTGARLMGIRPQQSGTIAFLVGSLMAAASGILIAPVNTIFYDSGFIIGLKAFVGAIIGGMVSFPVTAIGSAFVGILESFAAFLSSQFKEVIVFSVLIPVLLWRSYTLVHAEEEDDE